MFHARYALILGITFLVLPQSAAAKSDQNFPAPAQIYLNGENGTVEEVHQGQSGRMVICIQDAHADEIAQKNIARIVQELHRSYGVKLVGVEGSAGMVDTSLFATFPIAKAKELVSAYLFRKGKITGPELASIQISGPLVLFGIEDTPLYLAHYDSLVESIGLRKEALGMWAKLRKNVDLAKQNLYSPQLKFWDQQWQAYASGRISVREMVNILEKAASEKALSTQGLAHYGHYQDLLKLEKELDFMSIDKERAQAVEHISRVMGAKELREFTAMALQYRLGRFSPLEFHRRLLHYLTRFQRISPRLTQYAQYLEIASMVDRKGLRADMFALWEQIFAKQADRRDSQESLHNLDKGLRVAGKFLGLRASRDDYQSFQRQWLQGGATGLIGRVRAACMRAGTVFTMPPDANDVLQKGMEKAQAFYALALKRDKALAANMLDQMKQKGTTIAILLAGGFHTDGVLDALRRNDVSYVVLLPRAGEKPPEERYMALLREKETPFLNLYRSTKNTDVLSGSIGWLQRDKHPTGFNATALAINSFFGNLMARFQDRMDDFRLEYVSSLLAVSFALNEMRAEIPGQWEQRLESLLQGKLIDPDLIEALKKDQAFIKTARALGRPIRISDSEFYLPVELDGVSFVYHFFSDDAARDRLPQGMWSREFTMGPVTGQVFGSAAMQSILASKLPIRAHPDIPTQVRADEEIQKGA